MLISQTVRPLFLESYCYRRLFRYMVKCLPKEHLGLSEGHFWCCVWEGEKSYHWYSVGRSQGCYWTSYIIQDSLPQHRIIQSKMSVVSRRILLWNNDRKLIILYGLGSGRDGQKLSTVFHVITCVYMHHLFKNSHCWVFKKNL